MARIIADVDNWLREHVDCVAELRGVSVKDVVQQALRQALAPVNPVRVTVQGGNFNVVSVLDDAGHYHETMRTLIRRDAVDEAKRLRAAWVRKRMQSRAEV